MNHRDAWAKAYEQQEGARTLHPGGPGKPTKFHAVKTRVDNHLFDSVKEAQRYGELRLLEKTGRIHLLRIHPKFPLMVAGEFIGIYTADFKFTEGDREVVEDVKSPPTRKLADYRLRTRLFCVLYPQFHFREI